MTLAVYVSTYLLEFSQVINLLLCLKSLKSKLYINRVKIQLSTYLFTYLLTYLLNPWCRVLLEKLTGLQLVKKFPAFHGTRRFITALTSVRHMSPFWASPIQSIYPHPTFWRSILLLSTHLRLGLPSGFFPSGFPTKTLYKYNSIRYKIKHSLKLCCVQNFYVSLFSSCKESFGTSCLDCCAV